MATREHRLTRIMLVLVVCLLLTSLICVSGWYLQARAGRVELSDLGTEARQALVEELFAVTGSGYRSAWFEPGVGYTLRPNQQHELWGDRFESNELGYRTGVVAKTPGTFRVLFVGDSWTYGMGLSERDSFPWQFQELANRVSGLGQPIEAWNLSLPGYNTLNQVHALELFLERLDPDAVVICPTSNDNHTSDIVLPDGTPKRPVGRRRDLFGSDHSLRYSRLASNSFRCLERWRRCASELAETAAWLKSRSIPCLIFFVADWEPVFVHRLVGQGPIAAPYLIVPQELSNDPDLRGPLPWKHGTRECYRLYAGLAYSALAELLGWKVDPRAEPAPELFLTLPEGDWRERSDELLRRQSSVIPTDFKPTLLRALQCAGPIDPATGLMGRAATLLIRKLPGSQRLSIRVRRIPGAPRLYPLELTATIPTRDGDHVTSTTVPADGPESHEFQVDLPPGLLPGSLIDLELRARRVTLAPGLLALRSVLVETVSQF